MSFKPVVFFFLAVTTLPTQCFSQTRGTSEETKRGLISLEEEVRRLTSEIGLLKDRLSKIDQEPRTISETGQSDQVVVFPDDPDYQLQLDKPSDHNTGIKFTTDSGITMSGAISASPRAGIAVMNKDQSAGSWLLVGNPGGVYGADIVAHAPTLRVGYGTDATIQFISGYTADHADPPVGQAYMWIARTDGVWKLLVRYNDGGVMRNGELILN